MNDLVAVSAGDFFHTYRDVAEGEVSGLFQPIPGAQSAFEAGQSFADGDWAGGLWSTMSVGMDLAATITDPLGTLLSSVASFLIDYMPPLPQMLDELAGNPALVNSIGQTWNNVSGELDSQAASLMGELGRVRASWQGEAADAYTAAALGLMEALSATAGATRALGVGFGIASGIVEATRGFVKQLIADLVGRLISYAIEEAATLGLATPLVIQQATVAITKTTTDVTQFTRALIRAMTHGEVDIRTLTTTWESVKPLIDHIKSGIETGSEGVQDQ